MSKRKHDHARCNARRGIAQRKCPGCGYDIGQVMFDLCRMCQDVEYKANAIERKLSASVYTPPVPWYGLRSY